MPSDNAYDPVCPVCHVRYGSKIMTKHTNACQRKRPVEWTAHFASFLA